MKISFTDCFIGYACSTARLRKYLISNNNLISNIYSAGVQTELEYGMVVGMGKAFMDQNLWGMFPAPSWICAMKN